jgi:hypothetical protein
MNMYAHPKSPDQQFDSLISWAMMMQAFLARKIHAHRTINTVSVSFDSRLEAEEFYRLIMKRGNSPA